MRSKRLVSSFENGQISTKMRGRTDVKEYEAGCEEVLNLFPLKTGGVSKAQGSMYMGEETSSTLHFGGIYLPYTSSSFADSSSLFIKRDVNGTATTMVTSGVAGSVTLTASAATFTSAWVGSYIYYAGNSMRITAYTSTTQVTATILVASVTTPPTGASAAWIRLTARLCAIRAGFASFTDILADTSFYGWFTYAFPSQLNCRYVQIGSLLFVVDATGATPPFVFDGTKITDMFPHVSTYPAAERIVRTQPFTSANVDGSHTMTLSAVGPGIVTLTSSKEFFTANVVDSFIVLTRDDATNIKTTYGRITTYTSTTQVSIDLEIAALDITATDNWRISAFSKFAGWPRSIAGYQQRVLLSGSSLESGAVYASGINAPSLWMDFFFAQDIGTTNDKSGVGRYGDPLSIDPFKFTPTGVGRVKSMGVMDSLFLLSDRGTTVISLLDGIFSISNIQAKQISQTVFSTLQPVTVGGKMFCTGADNRSIYAIGNTDNGFAESELTTYMDDSLDSQRATTDTKATIVQMGAIPLAKGFFALLSTGEILFVSHNEAKNTFGAFPRILGGLAGAYYNENNITSFIAFADFILCKVGRSFTVGSSTDVNTYELLSAPDVFAPYISNFNGAAVEIKPVYMDCWAKFALSAGTTYAAKEPYSSTTVIYPSGITLSVVADGAYLGEFVTDGSGELDLLVATYTTVYAGILFTSRLKTMPLEGTSNAGSARGDISRIDRIIALFYKTTFVKHGSTDTTYDTEFSTTPFTGERKLDIPMNPDLDVQLVFETSKPLPFTLLGLVALGVSYEGT